MVAFKRESQQFGATPAELTVKWAVSLRDTTEEVLVSKATHPPSQSLWAHVLETS